MTKSPLVSICIPTFNGERYLRETLKSVEKQTYNNFEVILSDDCSKDQTLNIIFNFKEEVNFPVHIYNHQPSGIGANWNNCLEHAKGKYIKILFQDDILYSDCITEMVKVLEIRSDVALISCKRDLIIEGEESNDLTAWFENYKDLQKDFNWQNKAHLTLTKSLFRESNFMCTPLNKIGEPSCVLFKKSIIKKVGFFNEDLKQILDYEFYYRLLKKANIVILNKKLVGFRLHPLQATQINKKNKIDEWTEYQKILLFNFFWLLSWANQKILFKNLLKNVGFNFSARK